MRLLRDRSLSSRILILLEIRRRPPSTLRPLAEAVGITEQAVSGYLRQLTKEKLALRKGKTWRITPEGEDILRDHVRELKAFADDIVRDLVMVESCSAIAKAPVRAGDRVALTMEHGRLVATPGKRSSSSGTAQTDAAKGSDVTVGQLRGIVKIQEAALTILDVPGSKEGGSAALPRGWLRKRLETLSPSQVAALDEAGEGALRAAGASLRLEFAPLHSAQAAVARGVSPVYVGSPESVGYLLADIELAKADGKAERLHYKVEKAPRKSAKGRTKGNSKGNTKGNTKGNSKGNTKGNTKGNSKGNTKGNSKGNTKGNSKGNTKGNSKGNTKGSTKGSTKGRAKGRAKRRE